MRKLFLLFSAAITIASTLQAQNPVIRDQFTADPTAFSETSVMSSTGSDNGCFNVGAGFVEDNYPT